MLGMNYKLRKLEEEGKPIQVAIVGAGQMGRGMAGQMVSMKGMKPSIVVDIKIDNVIRAFESAGIDKGNYVVTNSLQEANKALEQGKYVATESQDIATQANQIDVVVDATGFLEAGAEIATQAIKHHKHIVMLNVEADITVGSILKKMADEEGVVYTGSDGDEPGAVKGLYDFADALGFDIKVFGKGKNNAVDRDCNPDTCREKAIKRGMNPKMQCCFTDGTKTMVEITAMANATGFVPDVRGCHGPESDVKGLPKLLSLKSEGGIMNSYHTLEWINGIAPGVFLMFQSDQPFVNHELEYLSMGEGPNYVLYRPYHLCSLETPLTAARAVIEHAATIVPMAGPVCETMSIAKIDMKAGTVMDGIGGFCNYGLVDTHEVAKKIGAVPIGLIEDAKLKVDVKKGEVITYDMVDLKTDTLIYKLRMQQDQLFN